MHQSNVFDEGIEPVNNNDHIYRVSQKKVTFRMLLEPRCTHLITSSQHPSQPDRKESVSGNDFFGRFILRPRIKDQALVSHVCGKKRRRSTQLQVGFVGFSIILKATFLGHPVII